MSAAEPSSFTTVNLAALPLALAGLAPAIKAIISGVQAPDALRKSYREDRLRVRAAIEADQVLPNLIALIREILTEMQIDRDERAIEGSLRSVDHIGRLETLSELYADHRNTQAFLDASERWARRKALWSALFLIPFSYVALVIGVPHVPRPLGAVLMAGGVGLVLATIAVTSWYQEVSYKNRFADLCRAYD